MSIAVLFTDLIGGVYDLTWGNAISFGKMQIDEMKKINVLVINQDTNRACNNVIITPVPHPTEQLGTKEDTYDACTLCLSESGTFVSPINIGNIPAGGSISLWIKWDLPAGCNPGYGFYAVKAEGEYVL